MLSVRFYLDSNIANKSNWPGIGLLPPQIELPALIKLQIEVDAWSLIINDRFQFETFFVINFY